MKYFSGVEFLGFGAHPVYSNWDTRTLKDYHSLQYVHSGHLHIGLDNDKNVRRYEGPFAWLMYKNRYFRYGNPDGTPWAHYYVLFRGPRINEYIKKGLYPITLEPPIIKISNSVKFLNDILLLQECLKTFPAKQDLAVHMLEGILLQLHMQPPSQDINNNFSKEMHILATKINVSPMSTWDFEGTARKMGLSYSHFRLLFRNEMGCPPHQYVLRCKLGRAAAMLSEHKSKSIKEIAEETGFENLFYFNRVFRKYYHLPPARYRREMF